MKSILLLVIWLGATLGSVEAGNTRSAQSVPSKTKTLSACGHVDADLKKEVRIRGIYRVGLEWSELDSLKCVDAPRVWVNFSDHTDRSLEKNSVKVKALMESHSSGRRL